MEASSRDHSTWYYMYHVRSLSDRVLLKRSCARYPRHLNPQLVVAIYIVVYLVPFVRS